MFPALGLRLVRPMLDQVVRFSETGEYLTSSIDELLFVLREESRVEFGVWVDEAIHVHVQIRILEGSAISRTLHMDLLEDSLKVKIADEMVNRFSSLSGNQMIVVDLVGDSVEYVDWISFYQDKSKPLADQIPTSVSPTVLGLQRSRFARFRERFAHYHFAEVADMTIASKHCSLSDFVIWQQSRYLRMGEWTRA
jgi:hypothetical protein